MIIRVPLTRFGPQETDRSWLGPPGYTMTKGKIRVPAVSQGNALEVRIWVDKLED